MPFLSPIFISSWENERLFGDNRNSNTEPIVRKRNINKFLLLSDLWFYVKGRIFTPSGSCNKKFYDFAMENEKLDPIEKYIFTCIF